MIQRMLAILSLVPLAFLNSAWTPGSSWFTYCWSLAWRILNITNLWDEYNCVAVWAFFYIAFFWDWNENWPFPVLWPLLSFPNLLAYWVQHFHRIILAKAGKLMLNICWINENFEHYFTNMWDECNCAVVWAFFGIAFLWDCNENWSFPVLWPLLSFPNLLAYWVAALSQHHLPGFEIIQLEFHHLH